jgi:hypothetical protein
MHNLVRLLGEVRWRSPRGLPCVAALSLDGTWLIPPYLSAEAQSRLRPYLDDLLGALNQLYSPRLPLGRTPTPPEFELGMAELREAAGDLGGTVIWHKPIGNMPSLEAGSSHL